MVISTAERTLESHVCPRFRLSLVGGGGFPKGLNSGGEGREIIGRRNVVCVAWIVQKVVNRDKMK